MHIPQNENPALATAQLEGLDAQEIFAHLPRNRCGERDRHYMEEVLQDGFGNRESADMLARFEEPFAQKSNSIADLSAC